MHGIFCGVDPFKKRICTQETTYEKQQYNVQWDIHLDWIFPFMQK